MNEIYEWLENVDQTLNIPPEPMDESLIAGIPMDEIMPLNLDENNTHFEYPQIDTETFPIDPALYRIHPSAPATFGQSIVIVPEEFAEATSRLLIYLVQTIEVPNDAEIPNTGEAEDPESPSVIDGVRVCSNPKSKEIKEIIDLRRFGYDRRTYYLARTRQGTYYWFHSPLIERDRRLRDLIGDHRYRSRTETVGGGMHGVRRLRSGREVKM